jgi:hypothetical protein
LDWGEGRDGLEPRSRSEQETSFARLGNPMSGAVDRLKPGENETVLLELESEFPDLSQGYDKLINLIGHQSDSLPTSLHHEAVGKCFFLQGS